ncbi:MAG TPA: signal peptidase I [Ruminococcaceae bacterium]|nr:signal peptidase I [Oscillospiraceae bacterium]
MTPEQAKKERSRWIKIYDLIGSVVTALVLIFIVFTFVGRPASVVGTSMVPTLQDGDWLFVVPKQEYNYGDIVIITQPNAFNEPLVKRIIATEGQTVDINFVSGQVFIDSQEIEEPYINELTKRSGDVTFPLVVPKGKVFVMGDNRMHSTDSRSTDVGFIDTRYILGRAAVRVLPFGDMNIYDNFQQGEE